MKWVVFAVAGLAALVAIIAGIGSMFPRNHVASRTLRVKRTPQDLWPVITELMAASDVPTDIVESDPPRRLVSRVRESEKMFGGTWTVVLAPAAPSPGSSQADGSTVTITEDGWVANPIFRFMSRLVIGHHATMDALLKNVAKRFNEEPSLSGE